MLHTGAADGGHRSGAHHAQKGGLRYPGLHDDGAADVLVELRHGDRAEDDLARALKPVTREHGRLYRRTRALGEDRHRLTVDL